MPRAIRSSAASPAKKITHRGRPPERAASLLIGELGLADALIVVSRELQRARKARSRLRFQFWAEVRDKIVRQPHGGGLCHYASRTAVAP
jgi:uncharacterized membrane protein